MSAPRTGRGPSVTLAAMLSRTLPVVLLMAATTLTPGPARAQDSAPSPVDGAELFVAQCSRCHGVDGDGQGPEVLDRPARNFKDGGFSFGNTQLAIGRTIRNGVPGSPMPAFGEALSDADVAAIARHVMSLAPAQLEVADADTILHVIDHPVVARGLLPPIAEGGRVRPRGLLLGLPGGLTFEYDGANGSLLGVRAGEFVKRSDWTGRGGTGLEPLGQVIWLHDDYTAARPLGMSVRGGDGLDDLRPLHLSLRAAETGAEPRLRWTVRDGDQVLGTLSESPRAVRTTSTSGFVRRFDFERASATGGFGGRMDIGFRGGVRGGSQRNDRAIALISEDGRTAMALRPLADGEQWSRLLDGERQAIEIIDRDAPASLEIATLLATSDTPLTTDLVLAELSW